MKVVQADAADLRLPTRPYVVVANPPFAVTSTLLRRLVGRGSRLSRAELVVPRPIGLRWAAGACRPARLATAFRFAVEATVPRSAFAPPAPVDSVVLSIRRR